MAHSSRPFPFDAAHRFTLEAYHRLVEEGHLEEKPRSVEPLDGRIVPMSPIGPRHEQVVFRLGRAFIGQERGRFETNKATPLPIPDHDEPEPDLLLYWLGAADEEHHVQPADVFLAVEASQSTLGCDLGSKAKIYEGAKIPEYWLVDLRKNGLHVFTLEAGGYKETLLERGSASPRAFPDVTIDLDAVFHVR